METAAHRALRENTVAVAQAIQRHLEILPLYLIQTAFMTRAQFGTISTTAGASNADKANEILTLVEAKINRGHDGLEWLKQFVMILTKQEIREYDVAKDIAKVYGESSSD